QIGGIARRGKPDGPDAIFDVFGAFVVRRDFERLEQPIQIFDSVTVLSPRQRARRLNGLGSLGIERLRERRCRPQAHRNHQQRAWWGLAHWESLSLARLEAPLDLVNDVDAPFAADQTIGAMPAAQGFQGVADLHLLLT